MQVINLFQFGGASLENFLAKILALKMNSIRNPYFKNSPPNIRDALYWGRTEPTKTYYRVKQGEKINYVDVISFYPYT